MDKIREEFETNGYSRDLDEMDLLILECRRKKNQAIFSSSCLALDLRETIEKVRTKLISLRPLGNKQCCVFCKKNREKWEVYSTHIIRDESGVTCPILQKYICPMCEATGKQAHTIKYCPLNGGIVVAATDAVLKTPRNCTGRRRF